MIKKYETIQSFDLNRGDWFVVVDKNGAELFDFDIIDRIANIVMVKKLKCGDVYWGLYYRSPWNDPILRIVDNKGNHLGCMSYRHVCCYDTVMEHLCKDEAQCVFEYLRNIIKCTNIK